MTRYSVFIHQDVLSTAPRTGQQKRLVMDFIRGLANVPNSRGDFTERDASGRQLEVKIVGRYAVTYWADHAVKEIKVVDVRPADK